MAVVETASAATQSAAAAGVGAAVPLRRMAEAKTAVAAVTKAVATTAVAAAAATTTQVTTAVAQAASMVEAAEEKPPTQVDVPQLAVALATAEPPEAETAVTKAASQDAHGPQQVHAGDMEWTGVRQCACLDPCLGTPLPPPKSRDVVLPLPQKTTALPAGHTERTAAHLSDDSDLCAGIQQPTPWICHPSQESAP